MPRLTILQDERPVESLELVGDQVTIGRVPGLDVVLPGSTVSRKHARLAREGDGWFVEDLGSVNGIRVRGSRVDRTTLEPGDAIQVENYIVVFEPPTDLFERAWRRPDEELAPNWGMTFVSTDGLDASGSVTLERPFPADAVTIRRPSEEHDSP